GERQPITNLSYFSSRNNGLAGGNLTANSTGALPTVGEVRRTVAIVIDDAGLSAQSIVLVRKELAKVISEQVQPNDLVAIIKTSGSVGVLQQFTTDKGKLLSVIENLQFRPLTSVGLSPFSSIGVSFADQVAANNNIGERNKEGKVSFEQSTSVESLVELNRNLTVTSGSLGVLNTTIGAMNRLPGRKSILYVAEGIDGLFEGGRFTSNNISAARTSADNLGGTASIFSDVKKLREQLRGITEIANRSTIAIYTLDPRGTLPVNFSASDRMLGGMGERESGGSNDRELTDRGDNLKASQQGLKFLSEETSGKSFINTNDLGKSLRETLDSQNGYYILAYQPTADTFDPNQRRFNKLAVKVKRPNVDVTFRSGFFNVAEESREKKNITPERTLLENIFSPYKSTDINLRITSIFAADEQVATIRSFVNIEAGNLKFTDGADGTKTAKFDVIAVNFNADGIPVATVSKTFDVNVSPKNYERLLTDGIAYNLTFTTKAKGAQNIKVSVRDRNTLKIGTASQSVEIPNFDRNSVALSGIVLQNFTTQEWQNVQGGKAPTDAASRMQTDTARRQFKKGTVLSFNYGIYSAASFRSKSQAQFTVFKDGKELFKGAAEE
ncbi:MAG: VWA domain-containing protein, partial [Pyrinomonadaceae bacterium]|nr:VWA domain-containing protein [Pyrinomonadaceae bacterium]